MGSTGCAPRESYCISSCWFQCFRHRGWSPCRWLYDSWGGDQSAFDRCRWWPFRLPAVLGDVFVLNRAAVPQTCIWSMTWQAQCSLTSCPLDEPLLASHEVSYMTSTFQPVGQLRWRHTQRFSRCTTSRNCASACGDCIRKLSSFGKHKTQRQSCSSILRAATPCLALRERYAVWSSFVSLIRSTPGTLHA